MNPATSSSFALFSASCVASICYLRSVRKVAPLSVEELLTRFPSLKEPLSGKAPIVGLYFAAGWCDDCWKATPMLEEVVHAQKKLGLNVVQIVYVASDRTKEEMKDFLPSLFAAVPFDSFEERSRLKRHFHVCAKKEMSKLGIPQQRRLGGTPTLVLIETASGRILSNDAVDQYMKVESKECTPEQVLDEWSSLLSK